MEDIRETVTKKRMKLQRWRPSGKKCWDKKCRESKTELNRKLREYKAGKIDWKGFAMEKKIKKRIYKESEEKQRKKEIEKIMNIKDETEI